MKKCCIVTALVTLVFLATALAADAATYCVGPSATGSGSGADWNNLKAWSGTPARGDTWYLETGSYAGKTFNTANSGTTLISIKKAIASDHVTDTGWVSSMANQATFTGVILFGSSYWTLDGQVGAGASVSPPDTTPSDYGFASGGGTQGFGISVPSTVITGITINHVYALASSSDTQKEYFYGYLGGGSYEVNNLTIAYNYLDGWQGALMTKGQGSHPYTGFVFQYNLCFNGFSSSANHGEWINPNEQPLTGAIIRYNIFKGYSGSAGMTGTIVANNSANTGAQVYGNVFDTLRVGNGCISATSAGNMVNAAVYNNTFLNFTSDSGAWLGGLSGQGSGNVALNNLIYNMAGSCDPIWSSDYDAYYSASGNPGESHQQTASGSPFKNSAGQVYTLTANTTAGENLGSPYNVDALGNTRTTWTRGAFEFGTASTNAVISVAPSSLNFGSILTNTTSQLSLTVQNVGAGTLAGTASVAAPFSIVSGGTYSLSANQSQSIAVRYSPTAAGNSSQNVTFAGGGGATAVVTGVATAVANLPPVVSAISANAADVDPSVAGIQIYQGSVVQYSGSASDPNGDPLTWQWIYTVNGGPETVLQSGSGSVAPASFAYPANSAGNTYVWMLRVSDGLATAESSLTVGVEAPPAPPGSLTFQAAAATVTAPFLVSNGILYQTTTVSDATSGGTAAFNFSLANAGSFVIQALVSATNLANNSLYVNIDGAPQDPGMSWDILPVTSGFEQRLVSWRGTGTSDADQFVPQIFVLSAGNHQVIIKGREAYTQLQSFSLLQLPSPPLNLHVVAGP